MWSVTSLSLPLSHRPSALIPPGITVASPWQRSAQNLTPTYQTGIIKSQFREHGLCVYVCACLAEVGATTGLWGSTKAGHPVLFTAKRLEGKCVYWNVVRSLWEDKLRAVYLSLFMLMFLRLLSQAFIIHFSPIFLLYVTSFLGLRACCWSVRPIFCYDTG